MSPSKCHTWGLTQLKETINIARSTLHCLSACEVWLYQPLSKKSHSKSNRCKVFISHDWLAFEVKRVTQRPHKAQTRNAILNCRDSHITYWPLGPYIFWFCLITLHYKLFIVAKVKNCKVHYGEVTQQCQDMTAEISVSSVCDEMTTAMLQK